MTHSKVFYLFEI